jgi:hypothetical protein
MKKFLLLFLLFPSLLTAQVVGTTRTEQYRASFEQRSAEFEDLINYNGPTIPVQLLSIGISEEVYNLYPELRDNRVGLGVTNIVIEFLEDTNRFTFTEDKTEIKNRMVRQFEASQAGVTANQIDLIGNIVLAKYFVYIEVYDFSVSEDETVNLRDGIKNTVVTRLGLQVRFVDSETGQFITGSGLGDATTTRELTFMNDDNFGEVRFNQSTIGISTRKGLEVAAINVITRMIRRGIFDN